MKKRKVLKYLGALAVVGGGLALVSCANAPEIKEPASSLDLFNLPNKLSNSTVTASTNPEYDFPDASEGVRFNSIKLRNEFIVASTTGAGYDQDWWEHCIEWAESTISYYRYLSSAEYWKTIKLKGTYTNTEYELVYHIVNGHNTDSDDYGHALSIELRTADKTIKLLDIETKENVNSFQDYYSSIVEEYIFKESMIITEAGAWERYYYNADGYLVKSSTVSDEDLYYINNVYLKAVDYGDLLSPDLDVELNIVSDVNNPLTINQIKSKITAIDDVDGDISSKVEIVSTTYDPNNLTLGRHPFSVRVSDSAGNTASATFYVYAYDITAPVITGTSSYSISYDDTLTIDDIKASLSVSDNYDETVELTITNDTYSSNLNKVGNHSITFVATDSSGNTSEEFVVSVEVYDRKSPIITAPGMIECSNDNVLDLNKIKSTISVVDGYDKKVTYTITGYEFYKARYQTLGDYSLILKATDTSGNTATHTITLRVIDGTIPNLFVPKNFVITLNKGQALTNDMILSFLAQVGEIQLSNVEFVESTYKALDGEYEVLVFMKDDTIYKTSIVVSDGTEPSNDNVEEKDGFWETIGNWFKGIWNNIVNWFKNLFGGSKEVVEDTTNKNN